MCWATQLEEIARLSYKPLQRGQRHFLYLACFALASAGKLLGESQAVQLVLDAPLLRTYLMAAAYFSMPVFIGLLLAAWFGGRDSRLMRGIAYLHLAYLLLALSLSLTGVIHLSITYPVFDTLFALSLLILLFITGRNVQQLNHDQRLVVAAFGIFAVLLLIDMAVAHGFLPWARIPLSLGALAFALVLVIISMRNYSSMQQAVQQLNITLEQRVAERTAALQTYVQKEQERSKQLSLLNRHSQQLDTLIDQLQHCTCLQQASDLLCHRLPDIFKPARLHIQPVAADIPLQANPAANLLVQVIPIAQPQGGQDSFLRCELVADDTLSKASRDLLTGFMLRLADRIGITLSGIRMQENLQKLSYEDALTGLKNRRFLDETLQREIQLAQCHRTPLSLLICDIDHFKRFNDRYGHDVGDMALRTVATVVREHFRGTDLPCRFGGEEFVVLMPSAAHADAIERAETMRRKVAQQPLNYQGQALGYVTVSIGIACWPDTCLTPDLLLVDADKALYRAKQQGRNRVESTTL